MTSLTPSEANQLAWNPVERVVGDILKGCCGRQPLREWRRFLTVAKPQKSIASKLHCQAGKLHSFSAKDTNKDRAMLRPPAARAVPLPLTAG